MAVYLSSLFAIRTTVTFIVSKCQFLMIPNSFHCSSYSTQGAQVHSHMWSSGKPIKVIKLDTQACYSKYTATSSEPQKYGNLCMWLIDMFPIKLILLQHQVTSLCLVLCCKSDGMASFTQHFFVSPGEIR